ncbi:MAG: Ig-like domain-containing protein, partial [Bacteroides sp.]|nr:Ig-like domain-containing protein [Bacteroides sp.]
MKKVMIGILILIPVLILLIVAAVSNFLKINAVIAVDSMSVVHKVGDKASQEAESLDLEFSGELLSGRFDELLAIKITPDYANHYTITWKISDVQFTDERSQNERKKYEADRDAHNKYVADYNSYNNQIKNCETIIENAEKKLAEDIAAIRASSLTQNLKTERIEALEEDFAALKAENEAKIADYKSKQSALVDTDVNYVADAAMLVDDNGKEVDGNTSSKFLVNSYCSFKLNISATANVSKTLRVNVKGYNVEDISVVDVNGETESAISVGDKLRLNANYIPVSSIVSTTEWESSDPSVASVDQNGVVTAHSAGTANITVKADRHDTGELVTSTVAHVVTVSAGASKFGSEFSTSKPFSLNAVGINPDDVISYEGCEIGTEENESKVAFTSDVAHIVTQNGTVTVNRCGDDDIEIENASVYEATDGYVFEVSALALKLRAVWKDVLKEGEPNGVTWASSDAKIVTVAQNGEVSAVSSGLVDITATRNGKSSSLTLNVQIKLASMNLRTGNDYYAVGLARETVFAAEKYRFDTDSHEKTVNNVLIEIIDAPKRSQFDSDSEFKKQLATFYNAYKYEIISGGDYAYFSTDESEPNRLIFIPSALEGKGKQTINVKVSAKYPKYAGNDRFTSEEVAIKVIYGVEVNNIAEFYKASDDQKAYAYAEGNLQERTIAFEHTNTERGRNDLYRLYNSEHSLRTYGISVMNTLRYEDKLDDKGNPLEIRDENDVKAYGDVYGNNNWLTAERNQIHNVDAMLWIVWSNVTVSNLNLRANKMDKDGTLSADETDGLKGQSIQIYSCDDYKTNRISNVRVEYCILENGRRAGQSYNADYVLDGIVVRNMASCAFYIPARMYPIEEDGKYVTYPVYSHMTLNNCVFANCLNTIASFSYERFSVTSEDDPFGDCDSGDGRFIRDDLAANAAYFKKYFYDEGINT